MTQFALTFATADDAVVAFTEGDAGPTLSGLAIPFGVPSGPALDGHRYRFTSPPRNAGELVDVVREHDKDAVIGRLSAPWAEQDSRGLGAIARLFDTTRGRDAIVEAREGVRRAFSAGTIIHRFTEAADGVRDVVDWSADHLGVVRRPAFSETAGIVVKCSAAPAEPTPKGTPMPDVVELPTVAELAEQVQAQLSIPTIGEIVEQVRAELGTAEDAHPLAQFSSFGHYLDAVYAAEGEQQQALITAFAVADQITANNPGVIVPGWRTTVQMNLNDRRPTIAGTGGSIPLPPTGMSSSWPYFDGDLDAIIAKQSAEKVTLSGPRIDIKKGDASIETAGAVSDLSYQLIERSSPAYKQAYLTIMFAAWARYTEKQYTDALIAGGTNAGALPTLTTQAQAKAWLFAASADVEDATGKPATYVGVNRALFVALGGSDLPAPQTGTVNAQGTADASALRINVSGLEVTRAPFLGTGQAIVTNDVAARFAETGPRVATAEDVRKLGQDVAVWGMYVPAEIYFPAGVRVYKPAA